MLVLFAGINSEKEGNTDWIEATLTTPSASSIMNLTGWYRA